MNAEQIAAELGKARRTSNGWSCRCPAHDDHDPSLSISDGDRGKLLVTCFAGCEPTAVISELKLRGLWPETGRSGDFLKRPTRTPAPKPEAPSTAAYAAHVWGRVVRGDDVVAAHPYAQRKGVRHACGAGRTTASGRIVGKDADCLIVPIRLGGVGEVVAVQAINAEGAKQTFGPMADAFLLLGDERDHRAHWFISEGWATAYAFHQLYQPAVACISFGKSRLQNVGMAAARLFAPDRLVIALEQDQ